MDNEPLQDEMRRLLSRLPDAPVASNFTARVMQAVDLEDARSREPQGRLFWRWRAFLPRVAVAAIALSFAGLTLQHYRVAEQRTTLAKDVALVAETPIPSMDALKNFDAIKGMSRPARADDELLALLQ